MFSSENELEDFIFEKIATADGYSDLFDLGLRTQGIIINNLLPMQDNDPDQIPITWHRQFEFNEHGRADIVGIYRYNGMIHYDLIELKNRPIEARDFDQLLRYKAGLLDYITNSGLTGVVHCSLVAPAFESGYWVHLMNPHIDVFTFSPHPYFVNEIMFSSKFPGDVPIIKSIHHKIKNQWPCIEL